MAENRKRSGEEVTGKEIIRDTSVLTSSKKWHELAGKGVTSLVIDDNENNLDEIPHQLCSLSTLRSFTLTWSKVKAIPDVVLKMDLREFCLHKCRLRDVNNIHCLRNLVKLELVDDGLRSIPNEIGELSGLINLDLTGNHLKSLPLGLGKLEKLKMLKVSGNDLAEIPASIGNMRALDSLDFSHNHITAIPEAIGRLRYLITLRISRNQIRTLPRSFERLERLQYLFLGHNHFVEVPSLLTHLHNLKTLNMDSNKVRAMSAPIESLTALLLDQNELEELPQAVFQCDRLEKLSVKFNRLAAIPAQIARLDRLRQLYISGNQFTRLPDDICTLTNLRHLVLRESKIEELPTNFDMLRRLNVIDVDGASLDGRYVYALNKEGIQGLMEQVVIRRNLVTDKEEGESELHYESDRGSSIFDSEDDPASEDEERVDEASASGSVSLAEGSGYRVNGSKSRRESMFPPGDRRS